MRNAAATTTKFSSLLKVVVAVSENLLNIYIGLVFGTLSVAVIAAQRGDVDFADCAGFAELTLHWQTRIMQENRPIPRFRQHAQTRRCQNRIEQCRFCTASRD
jgi:hypothetical protein